MKTSFHCLFSLIVPLGKLTNYLITFFLWIFDCSPYLLRPYLCFWCSFGVLTSLCYFKVQTFWFSFTLLGIHWGLVSFICVGKLSGVNSADTPVFSFSLIVSSGTQMCMKLFILCPSFSYDSFWFFYFFYHFLMFFSCIFFKLFF